MRIQNFLLGASMSALLAMTAPANADQNAVQKEGTVGDHDVVDHPVVSRKRSPRFSHKIAEIGSLERSS